MNTNDSRYLLLVSELRVRTYPGRHVKATEFRLSTWSPKHFTLDSILMRRIHISANTPWYVYLIHISSLQVA